jgi:saccharopepsin
LLATDSNNPVSSYGAAGILGLGFTSLSSIDSAVNKSGGSWGRAFLYNVFQAEPSTPNFITFALQRTNDPQDDITGTFTIGEYADGLDAVANMPNISTWPEESPNRWNLLLDGFYIGGVSQALSSAVFGVPSGKTVTLIDSGTSYT